MWQTTHEKLAPDKKEIQSDDGKGSVIAASVEKNESEEPHQ